MLLTTPLTLSIMHTPTHTYAHIPHSTQRKEAKGTKSVSVLENNKKFLNPYENTVPYVTYVSMLLFSTAPNMKNRASLIFNSLNH
jgi:hypothetical protein